MEHSHDQPRTPAEEASLAQTLLAKGDLVHGAFHLAGALVEEPLNEEWRVLADRYIAATAEPLELAPLKEGPEGNWLGIVVLRAHILSKIGSIPEAIALVLQAVMARPDMPYVEWAIVPEPPSSVTAAVAQIAMRVFDRPAWLAAAADLVRRLKPRIEDLLGVCVFPPELPANVGAPVWIQRVQVVAALALAGFDPEVPWPASRRKQALFDLACGPMDWTVDAAIIALTALAQTDPGIVGDVFELFLDLVRNQPRPGHVCYLWTVIYCIQQLPGLAKEYRDWAAGYQQQMQPDQPK